MEHLPKELKYQSYIYLPYREILNYYPELVDNKSFWLQKSAMEVGKFPDVEFQKFFDRPLYVQTDYPNLARYIRILAYSGLAVPGNGVYPGSELYLKGNELLRHALKDGDQELMDYLYRLHPNYKIAGDVCLMQNNTAPLRYLDHPTVSRDVLYAFFKIADKLEIEQLLEYGLTFEPNGVNRIISTVMNDLKIKGLGDRVNFTQDPYETIYSQILADNVTSNFAIPPGTLYSPLYALLAYRDNPQSFYKIFSNYENLADRDKFVTRMLMFANYGSNIFTHIMEHHLDIVQRLFTNQESARRIIVTKKWNDFAGLATIYQNLGQEGRSIFPPNSPSSFPTEFYNLA